MLKIHIKPKVHVAAAFLFTWQLLTRFFQHFKTVGVLVLAWMLATNMAMAMDPAIDNIGFMHPPPRALKEKFPMCDAFMNMQWIDKGKKYAYVNYEAIIRSDKDGKPKNERKMIWAVTDFYNGVPSGSYHDVSQYKHEGRLQEIFDSLKKGSVHHEIGVGLFIDHRGETIILRYTGDVNYDELHPLLSDHKQTVCIAYPDGKRAWIVEAKNVRQAYSTEEIDKLAETFKSKTWDIPRSRIEALWLLDINMDGETDFLFDGTFLYSSPAGLQEMKQDFEYPNFKHTFPPREQKCTVNKNYLRHRLTTDGKQYYYFDGQCNLTALSTSKQGK